MVAGTDPRPQGAAARGWLATPVRRRALFTALYFGEGAPIGFVWWTLPVLLRRRGLEPDQITGLTSLLVLPWALKFLWGPWIDRPGRSLKTWIVASQALMVVSLVPLLFLDLSASFEALAPLLLLHATAAATQDASIDALAVRTTEEHERGRLNGWMQAGMLLGRGLFGGAALALGLAQGQVAVVGALVLVIGLLLLLHLAWSEGRAAPGGTTTQSGGTTVQPGGTTIEQGGTTVEPGERGPSREAWRVLGRSLATVGGACALLFALTGGTAFETVGALVGTYLSDAGLSDDELSRFFGLIVPGAMGAGALLAGVLVDRVGGRVTLAGCALACAALAGLVAAGGDGTGTLALLYLATGGFTAASYALFMDVTEPRVAATQFSLLMAATNLCEAGSARLGGIVATRDGYGAAFALAAAVGAVAVLLVPWISRPAGRGRVGAA